MMLMMQAQEASIISIIGGPFLKLRVFRYPPPTSKKWCSGPDGPRRLVFKTVRAHDAHFGGFTGPLKCLKNPSVPLGFASKTHVNFGVVLEGGPGGFLEKRRSNDAGRRHWRPPHGKARAMTCGGNPRALPDLRADAVPPTVKKRGRRRLTALGGPGRRAGGRGRWGGGTRLVWEQRRVGEGVV